MTLVETTIERILDFRIIHPIIVASSIVAAGVLWLFRFAFTRHREFIAFTGHMTREEAEVWPALKAQQKQG